MQLLDILHLERLNGYLYFDSRSDHSGKWRRCNRWTLVPGVKRWQTLEEIRYCRRMILALPADGTCCEAYDLAGARRQIAGEHLINPIEDRDRLSTGLQLIVLCGELSAVTNSLSI